MPGCQPTESPPIVPDPSRSELEISFQTIHEYFIILFTHFIGMPKTRERDAPCVRVCAERERECVCVCVRERERERENITTMLND